MPYTWFGGKSKALDLIWQLFGNDIKAFVDPFAGSQIVPLNAPYPIGHVVINDLDSFVTNFTRSIKYDHKTTAYWADYASNHVDLIAIREWLRQNREQLREQMVFNDVYYDPKVAGRWAWAINAIIDLLEKLGDVNLEAKAKYSEKLIRYKEVPSMSNSMQCIGSKGVFNGKLIEDLFLPFQGHKLLTWFEQLAWTVADWHVLNKDWLSTVNSPTVLGILGSNSKCALFLDPPYDLNQRQSVYSVDAFDIAKNVRDWLLTEQSKLGIPWLNNKIRIILCAYQDDLTDWSAFTDPGGKIYEWHRGSGMEAVAATDSERRSRKRKEILIASPSCVDLADNNKKGGFTKRTAVSILSGAEFV